MTFPTEQSPSRLEGVAHGRPRGAVGGRRRRCSRRHRDRPASRVRGMLQAVLGVPVLAPAIGRAARNIGGALRPHASQRIEARVEHGLDFTPVHATVRDHHRALSPE